MTVTTEKNDSVWTIVHDRPETRNAMDPESAQAIWEAMMEFEKSPSARVAVLWGKGANFCAGWDLKFASGLTNRVDFQREIVDHLAFPPEANAAGRGPLGPTRMELSKPTIAAIEGAAVAGGMELAMWCDMRVMSEDSYFGVYCRRWGIPLMDGGSVRLPRLVGQGRALEIALTGRKVNAQEALRIGLCERVTLRGEALAEAQAMAHEIARFPQGAVCADRRSLLEGYGRTVREALTIEWSNGLEATFEGTHGAGRFASGRGRHGDFGNI